MQKKTLYAVLAVIASLASTMLPAQSQQQQPQAPQAAESQFDLAGSYLRTFNTSTTGNGVSQKPENGNGFFIEGRYIKSTFLGAEVTYSYSTPANQSLTPVAGSCGYYCGNAPRTVTAYQNETSVDWVVSKEMGKLRPFAVAGLGFMITVGSGDSYALNTPVRVTYIAGGGTDYALSPRFGLRVQVRDNVYKAPNVTFAYPATGKFMQTVQPTFGVYFKL